MIQSSVPSRSLDRLELRKLLPWVIGGIFVLQFLLLLVLREHAAVVSRWMTTAIAALAMVSILDRVRRVGGRDRPTWLWVALSMFLWALAHGVETAIGQSNGAADLSVDAADAFYIASIFPLLIAFSSTREMQSLRVVFVFNFAQIVLGCFLSYVLLYRMSITPEAAETVMGKIYGVACMLLAVMSLLRSLTWTTEEERRCVFQINLFLWIFLPIDLGMNYATEHLGLKSGTLFDLAWNIPFAISGWKVATLPIGESGAAAAGAETAGPLQRRLGKGRVLVECLCPMLINAGIFVLGAAVLRQHFFLGLISLFALLVVQGVQSAVVQMNYLEGRELLIERELALEVANEAFADMALMDPLTGSANRRRLNTALEEAWRHCTREGRPISLLMVDVDFFKGVNDRHGHPYGDKCLVELASVLEAEAHRSGDLVARVGGEEFVLLLPETDAAGAAMVAAKVHEAIRELKIESLASPFDGLLTISIGVACCLPAALGPGSGITPRKLIETSDKALYQAKTQGRNRTVTTTLG